MCSITYDYAITSGFYFQRIQLLSIVEEYISIIIIIYMKYILGSEPFRKFFVPTLYESPSLNRVSKVSKRKYTFSKSTKSV